MNQQQVQATTADGKVFYSEGAVAAEVVVGAPKTQAMEESEPFEQPSYSPLEGCYVGFCYATQFLMPICYCCNLQTINSYERGVILRLGKKMHADTLSGGLHLVLPQVDELLKVDVRELMIDIPPQQVISREGLSMTVDSVLYYKVFNASKALLSIKNVRYAVTMLAQTKLREVLALHTYDQIQLERKNLAEHLKRVLDDATDPWGVDVCRVELTDLRLPPRLQDAMGKEAEERRKAQAALIQAQGRAEVQLINATNAQKTRLIQAETEAKARVITANALANTKLIEAEGEEKAAPGFKEAAEVMNEAPGTMQLRFLQTLSKIGTGQSNTIMMPCDPASMNSVIQAQTTRSLTRS
jgi:regulator of protease activity HflC (stomatin/prohibitin superfamily)